MTARITISTDQMPRYLGCCFAAPPGRGVAGRTALARPLGSIGDGPPKLAGAASRGVVIGPGWLFAGRGGREAAWVGWANTCGRSLADETRLAVVA
jgi:hypothetical protein